MHFSRTGHRLSMGILSFWHARKLSQRSMNIKQKVENKMIAGSMLPTQHGVWHASIKLPSAHKIFDNKVPQTSTNNFYQG